MLTSISWAPRLTSAEVPAAVKDLKDKDARVRAAASRRLVLLGVNAETASPALVEALKDSDSVVRHRSDGCSHIDARGNLNVFGYLQFIGEMMARDGFEPPTPVFSGPLPNRGNG
jgi:hypothetical protein